jgi:hypothetical protein
MAILIPTDDVTLESGDNVSTVIFKHTWDGRPIETTRRDCIFSFEGKKLLFTIITILFNPDGTKTVYGVGGGASNPYCVQNVDMFVRIFKDIPDIQKVVIFGDYTGALRQFDTRTGQLMYKLVQNKTYTELTPTENIVVMGTSAGMMPSLDFASECEKARIPTTVVLIDPVGLIPHPSMIRDFFMQITDTHRFFMDRGRNPFSAWLQVWELIAQSWGVLGDHKSSIRNIFRSLIFHEKLIMWQEKRKYNIHGPLLLVDVEIGMIRNGLYEEQAKQLSRDVKVKLIFATRGLDPIARKLQGVDSVKAYYHKHVFAQIPEENLSVSLIDGTHATMFNSYQAGAIAKLIEEYIA